LLSLPEQALTQVDLGRMNLLCAEGLPGAERLNIPDPLLTLDDMAFRE
jgi:hypothetical protein